MSKKKWPDVDRRKKWPKYEGHMFIPIYGGEIYLFKTQEKFFQAVEFLGGKKESDLYNGNATHFVNDKGDSLYLIGWYNDELSTLVHEITHVGIFLMTHVGIDPRSDDGEAMCYLTGYLFQCLTK
jgi:hypothetical protein